jgi:hypothetical protein
MYDLTNTYFEGRKTGSKIAVEDKKHQKITLQKIESEQYNDFS